MAKRGRISDQLTGGTKDVNPQYMRGKLTLSAANTATEQVVGTPIVRVGPATGQTAIIMELLRLYVDMPDVDLDAAAATSRDFEFSVSTTTSGGTPAITTLDIGSNIAYLRDTVRNAFTAAGTGTLYKADEPHTFDFTDSAGHGVLVATDNLFLQAKTSNQTAASTFRWKILYRFKKVSLVEYIGIVQSQE